MRQASFFRPYLDGRVDGRHLVVLRYHVRVVGVGHVHHVYHRVVVDEVVKLLLSKAAETAMTIPTAHDGLGPNKDTSKAKSAEMNWEHVSGQRN